MTCQLLEANPAWAHTIGAVSVTKDVRHKRLHRPWLNRAPTNFAKWEGVILPMES
jgi:hypothetical protein